MIRPRLIGSQHFNVDLVNQRTGLDPQTNQVMGMVVTSHPLHIIVEGTEGLQGEICLALYPSAESWMRIDQSCRNLLQVCTGTSDEMQITIGDLPHGLYAYGVLLDTNANQRMDFNLLGRPVERYAFSQGQLGVHLGVPTFEQAAFRHDGESTHRVRLQ